MVVLADTGVLFGGADPDDPRYADCVEVLDAHIGNLAVGEGRCGWRRKLVLSDSRQWLGVE